MNEAIKKLATVFAFTLAGLIGIAVLLGGSAGLFALIIWALSPGKALLYVAPAIIVAGMIAFGGAVLLFRFFRQELKQIRGTPSSALYVVLAVGVVMVAGYLVYNYPYYFYSRWTYHYPPQIWTTYNSPEGYSISIPSTWRDETTLSDQPMLYGLGTDAGSMFLKSMPKCFTPLVCPIDLDDMVIRIKVEPKAGKTVEQWIASQSDIQEWKRDSIDGKPVVWAKSKRQEQSWPSTNAIFWNDSRIARVQWIYDHDYKKPLFKDITRTFSFQSNN